MPRISLEDLWPFLLIAVLAYLGLMLLLYLSQSRLLYYPDLPSRALAATPDQVGLDYQSLHLTTDDGVRLHGWFIGAVNARATLLFFHGNAGNISHRLDSLKIFNSLGLATLIIDYRGFGQSEGRPSEAGSYRDAQAAWRYLTEERHIPASQIILFGRSLGAAVAAWTAARHRPMGLIIESAFTSVPEMAAKLYPYLPVRWLSRFQYNTRQSLQSVTSPVLVIHSRDDEIIPLQQGQALFQAAPEPKWFLELAGGHNDGFLVSGSRYIDGLERFVAGITPGKAD